MRREQINAIALTANRRWGDGKVVEGVQLSEKRRSCTAEVDQLSKSHDSDDSSVHSRSLACFRNTTERAGSVKVTE